LPKRLTHDEQDEQDRGDTQKQRIERIDNQVQCICRPALPPIGIKDAFNGGYVVLGVKVEFAFARCQCAERLIELLKDCNSKLKRDKGNKRDL
jgi:hypothetical protein